METKSLVIAAVIIAATAALAIAPVVTSNAMALRSGGSEERDTCVHNGNGRTTSGACSGDRGSSESTVTQTVYKCKGKFQATPCD
jgi:hypothetical protein